MMQPVVVKVGGTLLDCCSSMNRLFNAIGELQQHGWHPVLVHGGGVLIDHYLTAFNEETVKLDGLRVTTDNQMPLVAAALAGDANTALVAAAIKAGLQPVGLSLADGGMVTARRCRPELGWVGEVEANCDQLLKTLLTLGMLPVISSIAVDFQGHRLNVNADDAAVVVSQLLRAPLVLLSDVAGVLDGSGALIAHLDRTLAEQLIVEQVIQGGMKVKVLSAFSAAQTIQNDVVIASWRSPELLAGLAHGQSVGTLIKAQGHE
ncbi:MAG: acetylglutamate kinase [Ferrimonas sp.]